ncbi:MAG TPA: pilin [Candidatus Paceibacterota bacterium]|nr:pilin [Candidatus Paceibacterota bacterium]
MKKKLITLFSFVLGFAPLALFAQQQVGNASGCAGVESGTLQSVICTVGNVLDTLIPILIVLGIVYFVWGVVQYVIGDDEEAKKKGKNRMIYGIIGLVVIVAMWGLVGIITKTFGLSGTTNVTIPTLPIN